MSARGTHVRLAVRSVAKRWGPGSELRAVTFDVAAGSLVAVRGRSGSGKSTLLAVLAGWCRPDTGSVELDGVEVDLASQPWGRIAVVPQVMALVPELTVGENVGLGLGLEPSDVRSARIDEVLASLGLDAVSDRFPDEVSMGQQQRTAVARAVVGGPSVVLADEPTSHQDREHADAVVSVLRAAAALGSAVLVSSHDEAFTEAANAVVDLDV
jgi:putative ABC transport system ATP-binding protein